MLEFKYYMSEDTDDSIEIYDVEGSERSLIGLPDSIAHDPEDNVMYSKSQSLYILFKSDNKPDEGEFFSVPYTAIEIGRSIKVLHVF